MDAMAPAPRTIGAVLRRIRFAGWPQLLALALVLAACRAVSPGFFHLRLIDGRLFGSLIDVLDRGAPVALLSLGMTLVIATRGIDLSVGAVMAISGAVAATLVNAGSPVAIAVGAALAAGLGCGIWNGVLVAILRIQPIVATLILMVAGRGIAQLITGGQIVTFDDRALGFVGTGSVLGVPTPVVLVALVAVSIALLTRRTALGLFIESVGANERASAYAGVGASVVLIAAYAASGVCAALAGLVVAADIKGADANNAGLWLELDAILAVVVGGTSLFGGRFSLLLSLVGAMIIQAMNTGILLSGIRPEYNLIVKAIVVLAVLLLQSPPVRNRLSRTGGAVR
jgi:ribose/xylose/arabinose/galactoside ABC-type transport system permease subunit